MVLNTTFYNISVIPLLLALLVEYPEKTPDFPQVTDTLYHIILYRVHLVTSGIRTRTVSGNIHGLHR